eukprot:1159846-Pelagomonas_calceolata.AAC.23
MQSWGIRSPVIRGIHEQSFLLFMQSWGMRSPVIRGIHEQSFLLLMQSWGMRSPVIRGIHEQSSLLLMQQWGIRRRQYLGPVTALAFRLTPTFVKSPSACDSALMCYSIMLRRQGQQLRSWK